jgi:hypothetical protein
MVGRVGTEAARRTNGVPGSGLNEVAFTASTARSQRVTASLARSMMAFG